MSGMVTREYESTVLAFTDDGWFNATQAAAKYGKRPNDWLALQSTKEYLAALQRHNPNMGKSHVTRRGGDSITGNSGIAQKAGTWLHPKLAVRFAQWLDPDFAVWCDTQIDDLVRGKTDWRKLRHEAASSFKVMNAVMQLQRQQQGKPTAKHHYSNEARLVNWALTGEFGSVNRDELGEPELDMLAKLEERNTVLIGCGIEYNLRKMALERFVADCRSGQTRLTV